MCIERLASGGRYHVHWFLPMGLLFLPSFRMCEWSILGWLRPLLLQHLDMSWHQHGLFLDAGPHKLDPAMAQMACAALVPLLLRGVSLFLRGDGCLAGALPLELVARAAGRRPRAVLGVLRSGQLARAAVGEHLRRLGVVDFGPALCVHLGRRGGNSMRA